MEAHFTEKACSVKGFLVNSMNTRDF
jgi:hypothetical protein